jgi:hypothetical protein
MLLPCYRTTLPLEERFAIRETRLVAAAAPVMLMILSVQVHAGADTVLQSAAFTAELLEIARGLTESFVAWVQRGYAGAPAVMIGLAALIVLPVLAVLGLILRRVTAEVPHQPVQGETVAITPLDAWIEIEGQEGTRRKIGAGMLRIGRQDDNDLCIDHSTVHRYHAIVYRSPDDGIMVMDIGGDDGNGIKVNDVPVAQAVLTPGDRLSLGKVQLRFGAADM